MGLSWCACLTLFLFYEAGSSRADAGVMEMIGIQGGSVTFSLGTPVEQFKSVTWIVNQTNPIVTIGAGNPRSVFVTDSSYEGRLKVPPESYSLQLTNLRLEDTGTYRAQITTTSGTIHRQFTLRVYRQLSAPTIVCDSVTCGNETCDYNLTCMVREGGENVTYRWTHPAGDAVVSSGPILRLSQRPSSALPGITCTAQNPVSNNSTTITSNNFCTESYPESQSAKRGRTIGIVIAVIIVLIVIAVLVMNRKVRERVTQKWRPGAAGGAGADVENNTVYAQVGNYPQPLLQGALTQQNEASTPVTIPEVTCNTKGTQKGGPETKDEESKTIYSEVHLPNQSPLQTDDKKLSKAGPEFMENEKTIYCTANQPTNTQGTEASKSKHTDEFANTPGPKRTTEYDKII